MRDAKLGHFLRLQGKGLALAGGTQLCESSQGSGGNAQSLVTEQGVLAATTELETPSTNRKLGCMVEFQKAGAELPHFKRGVAD